MIDLLRIGCGQAGFGGLNLLARPRLVVLLPLAAAIRKRPLTFAARFRMDSGMGLSIAQCRAARALLDWSADELARVGSIGIMTIRRFEGGQTVSAASIEKIMATLTGAGITFVADGETSQSAGEGVRLSATRTG